jgi:putative SOS response-associated peptidase YedK
MCGKFTAMASWRQVVEFSWPLAGVGDDHSVTYRPMTMMPVVIYDRNAQRRRVVPMRWGFPHRMTPNRPDPIHARAETIDEKPAFRAAFHDGQRGLVAMRTFNSGLDSPNGKVEQWTINPGDGAPRGMTVLWRRFDVPSLPAPLLACVMVTVPASRLVGKIQDRMPAILDSQDWPVWLGEVPATAADAKAVLKTVEGVDWQLVREEKSGQTSFNWL